MEEVTRRGYSLASIDVERSSTAVHERYQHFSKGSTSVDDFDLALERARSLAVRLEEEPHVNPNTRTEKFSLRDPDGYYVTISALEAARRG